MLKKLLTTFIVLAATATAWAEGWSVTTEWSYGNEGSVDGQNTYTISVITWSESESKTLADAITAANSEGSYMIRIVGDITNQDDALSSINKEKVDLSKVIGMTNFGVFAEKTKVKYVILPDNTPKANVDALGKTVDAAASKKAHTEIVWKYYRKGEPTVYNGGRYVEGGIVKGKVSEEVTLENETKLCEGEVFYDKSGNAYEAKTSDDSKLVQLTAYTERYTYNDNGTTRLYPNSNGYYVVSENGGYVGVQNPTTVTVEKKNVEYTYVKDGQTYVYTFNGYTNPVGKKGEQLYMLEGATGYNIQKETKWMIDGKSDVYNEENGRLVTNNNIGHVDGTKIPLTKVSAYYVLNTNNIYEGPIRIDGKKAYGRNGGTPVELSFVYCYNDNGTEKEAGEGFYVSYDNKTIVPINNNGDWRPAKKEGGSWYIDWGSGFQLATNVTEDIVYKSIDGLNLYVNWNVWQKRYNVSKYGYKYNGTSYEGQVYTKDGKYYGYTDGTEIELESRISYTTNGGETYNDDVYTYNNEYFGYDGGNSVELETSEYYTQGGVTYPVTENDYKSEDGKKVYVGGTKTLLTPYNKEAYVITSSSVSGYSQNTLFTGRVYKETTGLIGGTETTVTYSAKGYCYNTDYIYTGEYTTKSVNNIIYGCIDDSVLSPLEAVYQYTYTDPINGETVVYQTMEQESSVTVTHNVELTASEESAGNIHLTAYVSKPGSLTYTLARWTELGVGNNHSGYGYKVTNVTALTLSGDANYADIGTNGANKSISKYGHVQYFNSDTDTDVIPDGTVPESEKDNTTYYKDPDVQGHPNTIENNFAAMDGNALTYIDLTDAVFAVQTDMNFANVNENFGTILLPTSPEMTLIPAKSFTNLYKGGISEICIPYNYEEIGDEAFYNTSISHFYTTDAAGNIITNGPNTMTFSENLRIIKTSNSHVTFSGSGANKITDVYVMRYNPEDAEFPTTQCQPNAFQESMTWGNGGNAGDMAHPISRANYQNQKMWISILHYPQSTEGTEHEHMYTDLTRVYTLKDETGFVDGKGKAFEWPKHGEFTQASNCIKGENGKKITHFDGTPYDENFLAKYRGWIEFVLVGKSNNERIDVQKETEFIQRDWYTLCVPYNLKKSHLFELFGIEKNESGYNTVKMLKETESKVVTDTMYPDIRTITEISRSVSNGKMAIHLSKPLLNDKDGNNWEVVIGKDGKGFDYNLLEGEDPVIIKGGHPFLIRGYVPAAWNDKIKNMGMYIMAIAASDNSNAALEGKEEPYKYNDECLVNNVALPCVKHHIHARNFDYNENDEKNKNQFVFKDAAHTDAACYHFIGTYTETKIPQYAYYIGKAGDGSHKFSRTTKTTFKWAPYSAVIVGLNNPKYNDDDFQGGITSIHNIIVGLDTPTNDLIILEGEDSARAGQALSIKFDENAFSGEATGITDININSNVNISNNKVYSINGQYMGTSLSNLPKGIYIINGQKKVVK